MKAKNRNKSRKEERQKESLQRQELYSKLSINQKIEKLDELLGKNLGSTKQRKKLKQSDKK